MRTMDEGLWNLHGVAGLCTKPVPAWLGGSPVTWSWAAIRFGRARPTQCFGLPIWLLFVASTSLKRGGSVN
jgi:hypothetical protein